MTEELTPDELDLGDILAGVNYPKEVVTVYLNPDVAYRLSKVREEIRVETLGRGDEETIETLEKQEEELLRVGREASLTFHLTGARRVDKDNVLSSVLEEFPLESDAFGRTKPNPAADEVYANRRWAIHVDKIEHASGVKEPVTESDIKVFRGQAPDSAVDDVERAIEKLDTGSKSGYEALAQGHDFLSQP